MLINQLSKETGITAHTIRYYEKYGLIRGKRDDGKKSNNYYHYDDETVYKLELIRDAKAAGFTLNEIKQLIDAWYDKAFSVEKKLAILDEKLLSIDEKIEQLLEIKKVIAAFKEDVVKDDC
jgi:MerR family transcriptional regulator, copper efflux regulator